MDELEQFKQTYFDECAELLAQAEEHLLTLEAGDGDVEDLHAIFRCVHSIKGGAGAFGFTRLVEFAHTFETLLDLMREGKVVLEATGMRIVLNGFDILADLVNMCQEGTEPATDFGEEVKSKLAALGRGEDPSTATASPAPAPAAEIVEDDFAPVALSSPMPDAIPVAQSGHDKLRRFDISFLPHAEMLARANEPQLIVRELKQLGRLSVACDLSKLPGLDEIQPEDCYLSWRFELETTADRDEIDEVFEFVVDDCELTIEEVAATDAMYLERDPEGSWALYRHVEDGDDEMIEMDPDGAWGLFAPTDGSAPPATADEEDPEGEWGLFAASEDPEEQPAVAAPTQPKAEVVNCAPASAPNAPAADKSASNRAAAPKAASAPNAASATATSIRVELDKVDRLVNMVGELVITQAMLDEQAGQLPADKYPALIHGLELLAQHTRELQESVMAIRAQPVKSVFSRVPRLVRELSGKLDKEVRLVTIGENTEVDKTVIEQIGDPLTHMIRNSIDHGIETPEDREASGKPREGTIWLSAEHRSGRIVIEIEDDGHGINRERVLEKAKDKGLIGPESNLSDEEIDNLIFAPGFSTAEKVSDVSGRGVGMDVVKRNIQSLGGRVHVTSEPGEGSRFTMALPLTLAVLDGMIVKAGSETYVLPLTNIIESLRPTREDVQKLVDRGTVLHIRGEYVRLIHLNRLFGLQGAIEDPCDGIVVLCETEGDQKVGLVVDELLGQQQVVIKSLEANYHPVKGVSGATILGSGRVALILDVVGLREMADGATPGPTRLAAQ